MTCKLIGEKEFESIVIKIRTSRTHGYELICLLKRYTIMTLVWI